MNKLILISLVIFFAICSRSWAEDNIPKYEPNDFTNKKVNFKSININNDTNFLEVNISSYLSRPNHTKTMPAVILLHGCTGLGKNKYQHAWKSLRQHAEILNENQIYLLEPLIKSSGGLLVPSTGIIDQYSLMQSYLGEFENNGGMVSYNSKVKKISITNNKFEIEVDNNENNQIFVGQKILVAKERLEKFLLDINIEQYNLVTEIKGKSLEGTICFHPLNNDGYVSADEINQSINIIFQLIDSNKDNKISLLELEELKVIVDILK